MLVSQRRHGITLLYHSPKDFFFKIAWIQNVELCCYIFKMDMYNLLARLSASSYQPLIRVPPWKFIRDIQSLFFHQRSICFPFLFWPSGFWERLFSCQSKDYFAALRGSGRCERALMDNCHLWFDAWLIARHLAEPLICSFPISVNKSPLPCALPPPRPLPVVAKEGLLKSRLASQTSSH